MSIFTKEPRELGQSIMTVKAEHDCGGPAFFSRGCGVFVCRACGQHEGLVRCFCGWSMSGRSGTQELIEMGENIDEDY